MPRLEIPSILKGACLFTELDGRLDPSCEAAVYLLINDDFKPEMARKFGDTMITHIEKPILVSALRNFSVNNAFEKHELVTINAVLREIESNKNMIKLSDDVSLSLANIIQKHMN
jgi:hypothetical protein